MANGNVSQIDYEQKGYLSLWLCNTASKDILFQYVEVDYGDEDEDEYEEEEKLDFQMGRDFNIAWYDEDFFEASHRGNMQGWDFNSRTFMHRKHNAHAETKISGCDEWYIQ